MRRAEAEREAAAVWWAGDPALELGYRHDRWHRNQGEREAEVALSWPLWLPGQRSARAAAADARLAHAEQLRMAARWRLAGEVHEAAWTVLARQSEHRLAQASAEGLTALARDVDRRVEAGELAPADALAARAERLEAAAAEAEALQQWTAARRRWTVLTGLTALPAEMQGPLTDAAPAPEAPAALDAHPELRLALAAVEEARKRLALVDVSRREPPELSVGLRREVPGRAEPAQASVGVALRVPLGTAARNRSLDAEARSALDLAEATAERLSEQLAAELQAAREAHDSAWQQWQAARERAALLRQRAQMIDRSFQAGESALPELLRALSAAAQADAALARQHAALGLARARTQQALGQLP
jgi:outer membrane protein TolC